MCHGKLKLHITLDTPSPLLSTWWWQHHAVGIFFFSVDREAGKSRWEDGRAILEENLLESAKDLRLG